MKPSYKKLWKLLIDRDMVKKDLQAVSGISWNSIAKISKGGTVSMDILLKICAALDCNVGDILDFVPDEEAAE